MMHVPIPTWAGSSLQSSASHNSIFSWMPKQLLKLEKLYLPFRKQKTEDFYPFGKPCNCHTFPEAS